MQAVADLLRQYILEGQPAGFCDGYTTRAMCRIASKGVDGVSEDDDRRSYIETAHGTDLYFYMWGASELSHIEKGER